MYIAGLERIMKAGQDLGLTGAGLRQYFDTEKVKLKEELSLSREARRLGVDVALLSDAGKHKDAILKQCQQKKDEDERRIAVLKKQIAALGSRTCLVRPPDLSLTPVHVSVSRPSHPARSSVPLQRELDFEAPDTNDLKAEGPEADEPQGSLSPEASSNNVPEVIIPNEH